MFLQYFVFNSNNFNESSSIANSVTFQSGTFLEMNAPPGVFSASYASAHPTSPPAIPPWTTASNSLWIASPTGFPVTSSGNGVTATETSFSFPSTSKNLYGLSLLSLVYEANNTGCEVACPGTSYSGGFDTWPVYQNVAQPVLQTVGYYFGIPGVSPVPGGTNFSTTNTTPSPLIVPFGQPTTIAAFAKQAVTNGFTNVFAYPQQYFATAVLADTNGNPTTNVTGILSPYGDFFPTQPGPVILTTMPDAATGATGQVTLNVIKLQLDVNHDGVMDTSFAGPDNTSAARPFQFWLNNDYDRWNEVDCLPLGVDCDMEQDDLQFAGSLSMVARLTGDCNYVNEENVRTIPCTRDLEDYARLWICGITTNLLAVLPTNSAVTLSWGDVGSPKPVNPTIDLFAAAETDGGSAYLTDGPTATNQIGYSPYVGRLGPGQSIVLNACEAGNCWRGGYFIWCGVSNGMGNLTLTVSQGGTNILAQTTAFIQLLDIKQMYERWTVGDDPAVAPASTAYLAANDLPPGVQRFLYGPPVGTNTPYILHVHGSNMQLWEKDRFAETMYKRLYWQGYQGRFGSFRWPTAGGFTGSATDATLNSAFFDKIQYTAWQSAPGLKTLLAQLNNEYPGQVRLSSHSMGNVVAGEALRQSTNGNVVSVYASFQGAVPSHSYDAGATNRALPTWADAGEPDTHAHYWTSNSPPYFYNVGGASSYVNYFNAQDYVLNIWNTDENLKPDSSLTYAFTTSDGYYKSGGYPTNYIDLSFPTNTYELFAFCVPARCYALGAQSNVAGVFFTPGQVDLFASPYSFGSAHKGHSAEFRSDNMNRAVFWSQLMTTFKLKPTQ